MKLREQRQAQTRARLLAAAAQVFARRGYHGASVPEIARAAGTSTGAVYSNFAGKEDLFLTLMEEEMRRQADQRLGQDLETAARGWVRYLDEQPEAFLLLLEFWSAAQRDPALRQRMAERLAGVRARLAELTGGPDAAAAAIQALAYGFAIQHLADPDGVPAEHFTAALMALRAGLPDVEMVDAKSRQRG